MAEKPEREGEQADITVVEAESDPPAQVKSKIVTK